MARPQRKTNELLIVALVFISFFEIQSNREFVDTVIQQPHVGRTKTTLRKIPTRLDGFISLRIAVHLEKCCR